MSDFYSVINEFEQLTQHYHFKSARKLFYPNLVVLTKHLDDIYYCSVIAKVHQDDGSLETTLWVGPIDRPDDGLESLSAHSKIVVGYSQTLDENFFKNCESKIINLIEGGVLDSLSATAKIELENPSIINRRYEVYKHYLLPFFAKVKDEIEDKKILRSKKQSQLIIEKVFNQLTGDQKAFFDKLTLAGTVLKIWPLCYIYSLSFLNQVKTTDPQINTAKCYS